MYTSVIVGTGFGGISAALALKKKGISNFIMLERRNYAGGTWLQNTYPGAAVDVQSPLYSLAGRPYPWSHLFAKQEEIAEYTNAIIEENDLKKHVRLNSEVSKAEWHSNHWLITLGKNSIKTKMIINATGPLSSPIVPKFKGLENFNGEAFHSNNWQHDVDIKNKRVAIIGSGASAIQIVPAIVEQVKSLHVVQRTPHWVLPRLDWSFAPWLRKLLAIKPIYSLVRWSVYWTLELRVIAFKYSRTALKLAAERPAKKHLKKQIKNPILRDKVTPKFTIGCKRILVSNTYYPALQHKNIVFHDQNDGIEEFTKNGIRFSQSSEVSIDIVIFATGFNALDSMVSYPVIGQHGISLSQQWQDYPRAYLGTSLPNFPNFFTITGPNTGIGHTSAIFVIESQLKYVMHCVNEISHNGVVSIQPSELAEDDYTNMVHKEMKRTVWANGGCNSWYQNAQGKVIAMFPGFSFSYRRLCSKFVKSHHIILR